MPAKATGLSSTPVGDEGFVPLHERLKRTLSERILLGAWSPGTAIPGEVELSAQFGVAVGTVRKALGALVAEGLLTRRPRVGTVVTGRSPAHALRFFFRYFRLRGADGALLHSQAVTLLLREEGASAQDAYRLGIATNEPVIRIHRLRRVDGKAVMLDQYRIPAGLVPGFPREATALPSLLYLYLLERWGIRVTAAREELRAELASADDRAALGLPTPAALLVIEETSFDQTGRPCLLATHRARTEDHRYVNEVR
ncbi:MAG: GntR family transcriptional regulator [Rhodospirillales bacterium]|nr:GntR family transcriptional regulator [Rhodospirillales bacterium]